MSKATGILFLSIGIVVGCFFKTDTHAQDDLSASRTGEIRELYVPFDQLDDLLGPDTERVFLDRAEYERLKAAATSTTESQAPISHAILESEYDAKIQGKRISINGNITIDLLRPGLQVVHLPFEGVGILRATLDGQPAQMSKATNGVELFVEGVGRHTLEVVVVSAVATDAAQQSIQLRVPRGAGGTLDVEVPGNVEVKSGAIVADRRVEKADNLTRLRLLLADAPMRVVMSLNNRQLRDSSIVMARAALVSELTVGYRRLHATYNFKVVAGAVQELAFEVGADATIYSVDCPGLSRWEIAEADGRRTLLVKLRAPATEDLKLQLLLEDSMNSPGDTLPGPAVQVRSERWQAPHLIPLQIQGYTAVHVLAVEERIAVEKLATEVSLPIRGELARELVPRRLLEAAPGAPELRVVGAFFATSTDASITASLAIPDVTWNVRTTMVFTVSDSGIVAQGAWAVSSEQAALFLADLELPPQWEVEWIATDGNVRIPFERHDDEEGQRVRVVLPKSVDRGQVANLEFRAKSVPSDWLDPWQNRSFEVPNFAIYPGGKSDAQDASGVAAAKSVENRGAIAIQSTDDLELEPVDTTAVVVLDDREKAQYQLAAIKTGLAYRYRANDWALEVRVERMAPRIVGRALTFHRIGNDSIDVHHECIFYIESASTDKLEFSLPEQVPAEVAIRGLDGVRVKETENSVQDGRRIWSVQFAEKRSGRVRLGIDYRMPLESEVARQLAETGRQVDIALPIVRTRGVDYQTGAVAVEADPELDAQFLEAPDIVDVGELVDADYDAGKQLRGVFGYLADQDELRVALQRRSVFGLPISLVQRADFAVALSATGTAHVAAEYRLKSKSPYVRMLLPENSKLWAVVVDGRPALPQRQQQQLLIPIAASGTSVQELKVVYETEIADLGFHSEIELLSPELWESGSADAPIPIADVAWSLTLPNGYRAIDAEGNRLDDATGPTGMQQTFESVLMLDKRVTATSGLAPANRVQALYPQTSTTMDDAAMPPPAMAPMELADGEVAEGLAEQANDQPRRGFGRPSQQSTSNPERGRNSDLAEVRQWALDGVRSLPIELEQLFQEGNQARWQSLGGQAGTTIVVQNESANRWLAAGVGLIVFLVGLPLQNMGRRFAYLLGVGVLAVVFPLLMDWQGELAITQNWVGISLFLLLVWYLIESLVQSVSRRMMRFIKKPSQLATTSLVAGCLTLSSLFASAVSAQEMPAGENGVSVESLEELRALIGLHLDEGSIAVPQDAVLIPYDPNDATQASDVQRILIPYQQYQLLKKLAEPGFENDESVPEAGFAWAGATMQATLHSDRDELVLRASIQVEQFVEREIAIPLAFGQCVMQEMKVDGKAARVHLVIPEQNGAHQKATAAKQSSEAAASGNPGVSSGTYLVRTKGKGTKRIEVVAAWRLQRRGGWRLLAGELPAIPATQIKFTLPRTGTEVRFANLNDRNTHTSENTGEEIVVPMPHDGRLMLQFRDQVSTAQVEQGLIARSRAYYDVREDSIRVNWLVDLEFRRGSRDRFTVLLPTDYLLEKVTGNNVRAWEIRRAESGQLVEIELLKEATGKEQLLIQASKVVDVFSNSDALMDGISLPSVEVSDAMLHEGEVTVRRSSMLDVRALETSGLTRIDVTEEPDWLKQQAADSPLPVEPYLAFQFGRSGFELPVSIQLLKTRRDIEVEGLLRISPGETSFEARLWVTPEKMPVYQVQMLVPAAFEMQKPRVGQRFEWSLENGEAEEVAAGYQLLTIYLPDGISSRTSIILIGKIETDLESDPTAGRTIDLPQVSVREATSATGTWIIQADPALAIRTQNLSQCRAVLLGQAGNWLTAEQRKLATTAIQFDGQDYGAEVVATQRAPVVKSVTVTNVKVTDRAIEETLYLEATISSAGIRQYKFLLPVSLSQARIQAPMTRRISVEEITDGTQVEVTLDLQDAVMGQFAVLVENDRVLTEGSQSVALPTVVTGQTDLRLITFENASRREIQAGNANAVNRLDAAELSQQRRTRQLAGLSDLVFRVDERAAQNSEPSLAFDTTKRQSVETSGARIGLSETTLVVDSHGTYRGVHEYRVENWTESFLEIGIPESARIWTVHVANVPVKPAQVAGNSGLVRIPLIKTAEGDLDYPVVLKYGGKLPKPGWWERVELPLLQAENIQVELSQVRLHVPESQRWFSFDGSLGKENDKGALEAGWISFRTRQISKLGELLDTSGNVYSKMRAGNNLKQLQAMSENRSSSSRAIASKQLQEQLKDNNEVLNRAREQVRAFEEENANVVEHFGNRAALDQRFGGQSNYRSLNVVDQLGFNFSVEGGKGMAPQEESKEFDKAWFFRNGLVDEDWSDKTRNLDANVGKAMEDSIDEFGAQIQEAAPDAGQLPMLQQRLLFDAENQTERFRENQPEMLGDYRQQAEKYKRKLENAPMSGENRSGSGREGVVWDMQAGQGLARSEFENESLSFVQPDVTLAVPRSEANNYFFESATPAYGGFQAVDEAGGMQAAGEQVGVAGRQMTPGRYTVPPEMDFALQADGVAQLGSQTMRGGQIAQQGQASGGMAGGFGGLAFQTNPQDVSGAQLPNSQVSDSGVAAGEAFLASLDVAMPSRGTEVLFTTPGGELSLSAQRVSERLIRRGLSLAAIFGLAVVIAVGYRLVTALLHYRWWRVGIVFGLVVASFVTLVTGTSLLFAGLLMLLALVTGLSLYPEKQMVKAAQ